MADKEELKQALQDSINEFRKEVENSVKNLVNQNMNDAMKGLNSGVLENSIKGDEFRKTFQEKLEDLIKKSVEFAKNAASETDSIVEQSGEAKHVVSKEKVVNGEKVEG